MNYAEARGRIRDGDLIAVRSNRPGLPALVRAVTNSPYTHTGVAIWLSCPQIGERGLYIAEMDGIKAVLTPLSQLDELSFDVFDCPVSRGDACHELLAVLRRPIHYDYLDLLRIGAHKLWGWALPKQDRRGLVCSALSARIYRNAGWLPGYGLPSLPAPSDLVAAIGQPPFVAVRV